ncbi:MAG: DMT family transporter, partial [Pseudomonadota bacterium]|nr:DMT family transporter [Pseudomonadota bacterium]
QAGHSDGSELIGGVAIILATVSYAFAAVWGRLKLTGYTPIQGAVGMLICSAAVSLLASCLISGQRGLRLTHNVFDAVQLLVGLGVLGTALAYLLYFRILQLAGSSNLMLVTIIVPVFAVALDAAILGQFVTGRNLLGFAVVAVGLLVLDGRLAERLKKGASE